MAVRRDYGKKSGGPAVVVVGMADGGSVGFFERLRAGNIDDPSSEAYRRWGAGSKAAPAPAPEPAPAPAPAPAPSAPAPKPSYDGPVSDYADGEESKSPDSTTVRPASRPSAQPKRSDGRRRAQPMKIDRSGTGIGAGLAAGLSVREARGEGSSPPKSAPASPVGGKKKVLGDIKDKVDPNTLLIKQMRHGGKVGGC